MRDQERTATTRPRLASDAARPQPAASPATIGRYRVLGVLGYGGMGVVYAGFDEQLRRRVAIKEIDRRSEDELQRRRARREAQALARLTHPNIVAIHEVFEVDTRLYIVMEHVVGQTLRQWLRERRPARAEVLAVLQQAGRGIAAVHAAGLVHRDLKPDNIMVGEDGRVRVMDFGLARVMDELELDATRGAEPLDEDEPSADLGPSTHTRSFLGTPAYASPEQHLGLEADERSDVYGFCVLSFEALHGERPFHAADVTALRRVMLAGQVSERAGDGVPAWLDVVLRRGLAVEPDARWPSMQELLAALERDPAARRNRRLRLLAALVVMVALAVGLAGMISRWREAEARARAEDEALARLRAVEQTIAEAEAAGDPATAEAAFRAFVSDPAHRPTRALARAWLGQGGRHRDEVEVATAAYAEAYVSARAPADEQAALRGLADLFLVQWNGAALERSVALARARGADDRTLDEQAVQARLWQRDLGGALAELDRPSHPRAEWRPLLESLAQVRSLSLPVQRLTIVPPGGPARVIVHGHERGELVLLDEALDEVDRVVDDGRLALVDGRPWAIAESADEAVLFDVIDGRILGSGRPPIHHAAAFDATGDGVPELFFTRAWPYFGFERWDLAGPGAVGERNAHEGTDATGTTFESHAVGDLDGDGAEELVIGFAEWQHFGFHVFRPDGRGELERVAARELGRVGAMATLRRGDRALLAVVNDRWIEAPDVFPTPPHTGEPPGVRLFALAHDELREVEAHPLPHAEALGRLQAFHGAAAGDLDGDGRDDLAVSMQQAEGGCWTLVLLQSAAGFALVPIGGLIVHGGTQLDDDPPLELLAHACPSRELVVLGMGSERLEPLRPPVIEWPAAPLDFADPLLAERWRRADDLTQLGLSRSAAHVLHDGSLMTTDARERSVLLEQAAELLVREDRAAELLELEHEAHGEPDALARALARQLWALTRLGRYEEALAVARQLAQAPGRAPAHDDEARARVEELSAMLDPTARFDGAFDAPLAPQWRLHAPGVARRDPAVGSLDLSLPASELPVAELPIAWDGRPLALELDLRLERLEFGACVVIELVDGNDEAWLGMRVCGQGGGERQQRNVYARAGRREAWRLVSTRATGSAIAPGSLALGMAYFPARGRAELVLDDGRGEGPVLGSDTIEAAPAAGQHRLVIRGEPSPEPTLALVRLLGLRLRGAHAREPSAQDRAQGHPAWLLAEREPAAALVALDALPQPPSSAALLRLFALSELGDVEGLVRAAPAVLACLDDERCFLGLTLALRRQPLAAAVLREQGGSALLPALRWALAVAVTHRSDASLRGELLDALQGIERYPPRNDQERAALQELLESRAELWQRSGDPERARRDREVAGALAGG